MSLVLFEDLMEEQIAKIPAMRINKSIERKPSFSWGNTPALRKYLDHFQEEHNPLVWSVPRKTVPSPSQGMTRRPVELNLCAIESRVELLNKVRLKPDYSFKKVLIPLWEHIQRRFELSSITMLEEQPSILLYPDFKIVDRVAGNAVDKNAGQFIWDVLRVEFNVEYSENYTPCNNN